VGIVKRAFLHCGWQKPKPSPPMGFFAQERGHAARPTARTCSVGGHCLKRQRKPLVRALLRVIASGSKAAARIGLPGAQGLAPTGGGFFFQAHRGGG